MAPDSTLHMTTMESVAENLACSIVIPTHNRPDLLPRAVRSALKACPPDGEVIVVDDHSQHPVDLSASGIVDERLRWVSNPGVGGAADARNRGCTVARGSVIFFLDDDDEMLPGYCARILSVVAHHPELTWGFAATSLLQTGKGEAVMGRFRLKTGVVPLNARPKDRVAATSEGFWIQRALFLALGGFDVRQRVDEDTDLCVSLMAQRRQPWYEALPGVRVHRGYAPMLTEGAQLTRSTSTSLTVQCYRRTCDKHLESFAPLSRERWYLCTRYLRRIVREQEPGATAWAFVSGLSPAPLRYAAAAFLNIKLLARGVYRLVGPRH